MIEFLGDDLWMIAKNNSNKWSVIGIGYKENEELCDTLWIAVQAKLKE